jgi:hypothetical protein
MNTIQKTKVKKLFNKEKIQCPINTLNMIDEHMTRMVYTMVRNCKDGNVKKLTPELFWVALGNLNNQKG